MKVEQYKTVFGKNFKELDEFVKNELEHGFQLYGNPYTVMSDAQNFGSGVFICQAMVKGLNPMGSQAHHP